MENHVMVGDHGIPVTSERKPVSHPSTILPPLSRAINSASSKPMNYLLLLLPSLATSKLTLASKFLAVRTPYPEFQVVGDNPRFDRQARYPSLRKLCTFPYFGFVR
jgi:hypothetical protein